MPMGPGTRLGPFEIQSAPVESFLRKRSFLRDLYEDLEISRYAASLLGFRPMIEALKQLNYIRILK